MSSRRAHASQILAVVVLAVALMSAGCSDGESNAVRGHSGRITTQTQPIPGSYNWDPNGWYAEDIWGGQLVIEESGCVYLDVMKQDDDWLSSAEQPLRSFLRLPETARFYSPHDGLPYLSNSGALHLDLGTSEIMSSGDYVIALGMQGWRQEHTQRGDDFMVFHSFDTSLYGHNSCNADVSFWVSQMGLPDSYVPSLPSEEPPLAGMTGTDDAYSSPGIGDIGVLQIAGRCPYLWLSDEKIDHSVRRTSLSVRQAHNIVFTQDGVDLRSTPISLRRSFFKLGQPEVQFDAETQILRLRDGPALKTGDLVEITGTYSEGKYKGMHHYIEECHAPNVIGSVYVRLLMPSFVEICNPTQDYGPYFCNPPKFNATLEALKPQIGK